MEKKVEVSQRSISNESEEETIKIIDEEITTTKTEVTEELPNYESINTMEDSILKQMLIMDTALFEKRIENNNNLRSVDDVQENNDIANDREEIQIFDFEDKFKCEWCALEFEEASCLTNHYIHCTNKEQRSATQQNVNEEQKQDSVEGICIVYEFEEEYKCEQCHLEFKEARDLIEHRTQCLSNKQQSAAPQNTNGEKGEDCSQEKLLPAVTEKMEGGIFLCNYCKLQIIDSEFYVKHLNKCRIKYSKLNREDKMVFKCSKCNFVALWKHDLAKHDVVHCDKKQFSCEVCGKLFKRKESVKYHMKIHDGTTQKRVKTKRYKCDKCEFTAANSYTLKQHMAQHNVKVREYKCSTCKFATYRKVYLKKHMFTHSKEKQFKCIYRSRDCTMEETGKCKTCEYESTHICKYAATQKSTLNMHILSHHSNKVKQYNCEICKFATHFKGHLRTHMFTHSDEKPFKCTYKNCNCVKKESCDCSTCDYSAISNALLMRHIRQRHTKEKIYHCEKCSYGTANSSNLKLHIKRKHT